MTAPIRVMIVDDSSVVRRMLTAALAKHPEVEVIGSAANGVIALSKLPQLAPEVVILDVEMPEMDGIAMLAQLRAHYPRLPVLMFSTLTERGANVTFDALAAGASDYVLKPSTQTGETLEGLVANSLVPKILGLARSRFTQAADAAIASLDQHVLKHPPTPAQPPPKPAPGPSNPFGKANAATAGKYTLKPISVLPGANAPKGAGEERKLALPSSPPPGKRLFPSSPPANAQSSGSLPLSAPPRGLGGAGGDLASRLALGGAAGAPTPSRRNSSLPAPMGSPLLRKPVQIIAIAASTGGPNALAEIVPRLPGGLPVPVVIVQHMPPIFTRCLADRLSSRSELKILESQGNERLAPGHVYIAPGNRHLELVRDAEGVRTLLSDAPPEHSCRPSADVLMRSVVRVYGGAVLGVVLTGMGQDGLGGAREIFEAGGRVLVQSGPTCVIWGMPKAVEEAGYAEAVVPLPELSAAILQRVGLGLVPIRQPESNR